MTISRVKLLICWALHWYFIKEEIALLINQCPRSRNIHFISMVMYRKVKIDLFCRGWHLLFSFNLMLLKYIRRRGHCLSPQTQVECKISWVWRKSQMNYRIRHIHSCLCAFCHFTRFEPAREKPPTLKNFHITLKSMHYGNIFEDKSPVCDSGE